MGIDEEIAEKEAVKQIILEQVAVYYDANKNRIFDLLAQSDQSKIRFTFPVAIDRSGVSPVIGVGMGFGKQWKFKTEITMPDPHQILLGLETERRKKDEDLLRRVDEQLNPSVASVEIASGENIVRIDANGISKLDRAIGKIERAIKAKKKTPKKTIKKKVAVSEMPS